MPRATAAGLLLHRPGPAGIEVLLAHMGGPFWSRRPHAWSIPKGEHGPDEAAADAAEREFREELGVAAPPGARRPLGTARYSSGKTVTAWAVLAPGFEAVEPVSNEVEIEWPPRSGRRIRIPEIDRVAWLPLPEARDAIVRGQLPLLDALELLVASEAGSGPASTGAG